MIDIKMSLSEMITYSTVLIRCQYSNGMSGSGTGFIINLCQNAKDNTCVPVLVTNNHVVENSIETIFEFCKSDDSGNPIDTEAVTISYKGNTWIHHPDKNVDLTCMFLADVLNLLQKAEVKVFYIPLETSFLALSS